jgi:hypothetical protein
MLANAALDIVAASCRAAPTLGIVDGLFEPAVCVLVIRRGARCGREKVRGFELTDAVRRWGLETTERGRRRQPPMYDISSLRFGITNWARCSE